MPGTVSDVSATLVDSTIRRPRWASKMRCCSAADNRAYNGSTSVFGICQVAQRRGGVVDLALAAEEHQDVAGPLVRQLVDGVDDGLHLIAVVVGVLRVIAAEGAIPQFDRIRPARSLR